MNSCVSKQEVKANLWLNNLDYFNGSCRQWPELNNVGFYRKLDDGKYEIVSVCDPKIKEFYSMHKDVLARMLNGRAKTKKEK